MLLIPTFVAPSLIPAAGLGLFAAAPVACGQPVWQFWSEFDRLFDPALVAELPAIARAFLDTYAYRSPDFPGMIVAPGDNARFLNHANTPNIESTGLLTHALVDIVTGEELTCDYRQTVTAWSGFG